MAEAGFNELKKAFPEVDEQYEAISWGADSKAVLLTVNLEHRAVDIMAAIGIDMQNQYPKTVNDPSIVKVLGEIERFCTFGYPVDQVGMTPVFRALEVEDWEDKTRENDPVELRNYIMEKCLLLILDLQEKLTAKAAIANQSDIA